MRKKRVMVIGPSRCGKTTLVNELNDYHGEIRKTQDIIYGENTIDVPGSFIENSWMYKHIIALSQDASHILILIDQSNCKYIYPPGFAKLFRCPVIGIITKCDLMSENKDSCLRQFKIIGISEPYFYISCFKGIGIDDLKKNLFGKG